MKIVLYFNVYKHAKIVVKCSYLSSICRSRSCSYMMSAGHKVHSISKYGCTVYINLQYLKDLQGVSVCSKQRHVPAMEYCIYMRTINIICIRSLLQNVYWRLFVFSRQLLQACHEVGYRGLPRPKARGR